MASDDSSGPSTSSPSASGPEAAPATTPPTATAPDPKKVEDADAGTETDPAVLRRRVWMSVGAVVGIWAVIYLTVVIAFVMSGGGESGSGGAAGAATPSPAPALPPGHFHGDGHDH